MAGLVVMSLMATSCSDDDDYTPGKEAGANDVTFADGSNKTLEFRRRGQGELFCEIDPFAVVKSGRISLAHISVRLVGVEVCEIEKVDPCIGREIVRRAKFRTG